MSINHEDYIKKRNEILIELLPPDLVYDALPNDDGIHQVDLNATRRDTAAQAIDALVLEVIGESEAPEYMQTPYRFIPVGSIEEVKRDSLREEQRRIVQGDKL